MKRFIFIFFIFTTYLQAGIYTAYGEENFLYAEEIKTSDIRLEIVSEISVLEDDLKKIKRKMETTEDPEEKKLLKNKIDAIKEKLKILKKQLEDYNQHINNIS